MGGREIILSAAHLHYTLINHPCYLFGGPHMRITLNCSDRESQMWYLHICQELQTDSLTY